MIVTQPEKRSAEIELDGGGKGIDQYTAETSHDNEAKNEVTDEHKQFQTSGAKSR